MKRHLYKIMSGLLIGIGAYLVISSLLFYRLQVFSRSDTEEEMKQHYRLKIEPKLDENYARLSYVDLPEVEQANLRKIVKWEVIDHDSALDVAARYHFALLTLTLSLFIVMLGLIVYLWGKIDALAKAMKEKT